MSFYKHFLNGIEYIENSNVDNFKKEFATNYQKKFVDKVKNIFVKTDNEPYNTNMDDIVPYVCQLMIIVTHVTREFMNMH